MIAERILESVSLGTVIPKPEAKVNFVVKGWGRRRGERALVYSIPNHRNPENPYEKGITESEFERAYEELRSSGKLTRDWFNKNLTACAKEGSCNYTTIGGIFELLGEATYSTRGLYVYRR
jgi:hypothetical protein